MIHHTTHPHSCLPGHCTPATAIVLGIALASAAATVAFAGPSLPAPLQALEKQGLSIVGTFPSPGGVTAYAAHMGTEPVALYLTADGKHVIAGNLFNVNGKNLTTDALAKVLAKPIADSRPSAIQWLFSS